MDLVVEEEYNNRKKARITGYRRGECFMETRWLYTTSENFPALREAAKETCVIPMGCVEKHGLHLPLGTDIITVSRRAYLASQIEPVCVFPDFTLVIFPPTAPIVRKVRL